MCPVCSTSSSVSGSVLSTLGQHSRAPLALPPPSFYFISFSFLLFFLITIVLIVCNVELRMSDSPTDARPPKLSFPASPLSSSTAPAPVQGAWEGTFERSKTVSGAVNTPSVNASSSSAEAASNKAYAAAAAAATVVVAADSEDVLLTAPFNLAGSSPPDGSSAASAGLQLPPSHMQARSQSAKRSPRPSTASLAEGRLVNIPDALDDMGGMSTSAAVGHAREGSSAGTCAFPPFPHLFSPSLICADFKHADLVCFFPFVIE